MYMCVCRGGGMCDSMIMVGVVYICMFCVCCVYVICVFYNFPVFCYIATIPVTLN